MTNWVIIKHLGQFGGHLGPFKANKWLIKAQKLTCTL